MKLTKRQKRIILILVLSFFLALTVVTITVLLVNKDNKDKEKSSSSVPSKNLPPADLAKVKTETITLLEQKLSANNVKSVDLLVKLKTDGHAIKFGFVTSESSSEMQSTAKDAGAAFLITKPFTPEAFRSALEPILGG